MSKKVKREKITISLPSKIDLSFRRDALNERLNFGEMLTKYREAWLREKEREKAQKEQKNQENQEKETKKES